MEDKKKGGKPKPDARKGPKTPRKPTLEREGFKPDADVEAGHE